MRHLRPSTPIFIEISFLRLDIVTATQQVVIDIREYFMNVFNVKTAGNPDNKRPTSIHLDFVFARYDPLDTMLNIRMGRIESRVHIMLTIPTEIGWLDYVRRDFKPLYRDVPEICGHHGLRRLAVSADTSLVRITPWNSYANICLTFYAGSQERRLGVFG